MSDNDNRIFDIVPKKPEDDFDENDWPPTPPDPQNDLPNAPIVESKTDNDTPDFSEEDDEELSGGDIDEEESIITEWDATDREELEHRLLYFLGVGLVAIVFLIYFAFQKDLMGVVFLVILCVAFVFYKFQKPKSYHYVISNYGLYINDKFFEYNTIHSFWVIETKKNKFLHFIFNKKYLPQLTLDISSLDINLIKSSLQKHIPEKEDVNDSIIDKLIRLLKF